MHWRWTQLRYPVHCVTRETSLLIILYAHNKLPAHPGQANSPVVLSQYCEQPCFFFVPVQRAALLFCPSTASSPVVLSQYSEQPCCFVPVQRAALLFCPSTASSPVVLSQYSAQQRQRDPDGVGGLVAEVVPDNSCLVFCPTRKNCEAVARMICAALKRYGRRMAD